MRKHLKDRHEVAHFWANKVQSAGQAGNVFFRDSTIFSYGSHFVIAKHIAPDVVAFTTRDYSPSTGQHKGIVRNAIPSELQVVFVPFPDSGVGENKRAVEASIERLVETATKARRQSTRQAPLAEAFYAAEQFNAFAKVMKDRSRINTAKLNLGSLEELKVFVETRDKREAAAKRKVERANAKAIADRRALWRAGAHDGYYGMGSGPTMLRLTPDHETIETSGHANIPVEAAVKLWPIILRVKGGTKDYEVGMELGHYRLTQIKQTGDIVVGCHNIPFLEIEGIAHELGLTNTSAAQRAFDQLAA